MDEPSQGTLPPAGPPGDRLDSWKEIAVYLNRDVTTVQRWEKREGMPVRRHQHDKIGSVYAFRAELDAWARRRNLPPAGDSADNTALPNPHGTLPLGRWNSLLPLAAVVASLAIGAILWLQRTEYFCRNPIADTHFQTVTDFDGGAQAAAVSRGGHFIAFLSDRDGQMDV